MDTLCSNESHMDSALPQCLLGMPLSLARLLEREPWSRHADKVCVSVSERVIECVCIYLCLCVCIYLCLNVRDYVCKCI